MVRSLPFIAMFACSSAQPTDTGETRDPIALRVATYNASLFGDRRGEIAERLSNSDVQASGVAEVIQHIRPDVLLINELDDGQDNADTLASAYFAVSQNGLDPMDYPHVYAAPSNTGVHSGFDLDNDGEITTMFGSTAYGGDAWGFGEYEGQYAFAIFSRFPIGTVRSFQTLRWADMPGHSMPPDWFDDDEAAAVRLSSKNHVDVPIEVADGRFVHVLASHPTPPAFDGPEDRNGRRNADEIKLWADYLDGGAGDYPTDDDGLSGGFAGEHFVIMGDLNADPADGGSREGAIRQLLDHPLVADPMPESEGALEQAEDQGGANTGHGTPASQDTADFEDQRLGNLRLDYVLPSTSLTVTDSGVFWPTSDAPEFALIGTFPFPISDHRPVWVDLEVP